MMTLLTQNWLFQKVLVYTDLHTKFRVPVMFGLGVRRGSIFVFPPPVKMRWSNRGGVLEDTF